MDDWQIQVELTKTETNKDVEKAEEFPMKQGDEYNVNGAEKEVEVSHKHATMELEERETNEFVKEEEECIIGEEESHSNEETRLEREEET